ncbi:MAG TPA: acetyltransferase [Thermotogota bacterium]|jgi:sugar O-acyltransferase (sialic acid O-acetyltransferase NeuD family)|nr:acetyltransferase [Thermotogota bacterium]OQC32685.1 MAG: putative acetyltransferase EpsM [Thermotogota bacterium ADurb.Bin062]HNW46560.1 acetyltransferase [Thermotogota bacterium]HNY81354.1 acetyltransferase [Thermotogota bacterium]HOD90145.1 acetyltransferase [Thermotogota bacterium]
MLPLAVYGAGGLGREILYYTHQYNEIHGKFVIEGFYDDGIEAGSIVDGYPVLGGLETLKRKTAPTALVMGIADTKIKGRLMESLSDHPNISFPTIVHPTAFLAHTAKLQEGVVLAPFTFVSLNAVVGRGVFVNVGTQLGHDAIIRDYCSLMPSVNLSGGVVLEEGCYVGVGAKILQNITIGAWSVVGANSLVLRNVPSGVTAFGTPAIPRKMV